MLKPQCTAGGLLLGPLGIGSVCAPPAPPSQVLILRGTNTYPISWAKRCKHLAHTHQEGLPVRQPLF